MRNLKDTNTALVLKNVWKIMKGSEAPWAQVLREKYHPKSDFLNTGRTHNCTKFWRNLVLCKAIIQQHLYWQIGYGESIPVFAQPWFPGGSNTRAGNAAQRQLRVSSLIDQETGTWDFQQLVSLFGYHMALGIATSDDVRLSTGGAPDTLLFTYARDGRFTVKKRPTN